MISAGFGALTIVLLLLGPGMFVYWTVRVIAMSAPLEILTKWPLWCLGIGGVYLLALWLAWKHRPRAASAPIALKSSRSIAATVTTGCSSGWRVRGRRRRALLLAAWVCLLLLVQYVTADCDGYDATWIEGCGRHKGILGHVFGLPLQRWTGADWLVLIGAAGVARWILRSTRAPATVSPQPSDQNEANMCGAELRGQAEQQNRTTSVGGGNA
jgi:hypothetical protein